MPEEVRIAFQVPEALEGGTYSNVVSVWHTPHEFTLDFATLPPTPQETSEGVVVPCRVVSRVKMPTTVVFDLIRAINEHDHV
jgi:hypothetical protein